MGTFVNSATGVQFSVDDSKDDRYTQGYESPNDQAKAPAKKSAARKSSK